MILARSLRHTFVLDGVLPDLCVRFLETLPDIPDHPVATSHTIRVRPRPDGFVDAECSWGRVFAGTERTLARILDTDFLRLALAEAGSTPILASTVLRSGAARLALIGVDEAAIAYVAVALTARGLAFEGCGFAFVTSSGLQPHPRKPHVNQARLRSMTEPGSSPHPYVELPFAQDVSCCVVDPTFAGQPWTVTRGPIGHFIYVDANEDGRTSLAPIGFAEALARTMRRIHVPVTNAIGLALLYRLLSGASYSRLNLGHVDRGAEAIVSALSRGH